MENTYYVYIYLDLNNKELYNYKNFNFDYKPFYVGKGKNSRMLSHLKCKGGNYLKNKIIKNHLNNNHIPDIIKLYENLTDKEAKELEIDIIKHFGRLNNNTGILTNMTDGGDGHSGLKQSEETKLKRSNSFKKSTFYITMNDPIYRQSIKDRFLIFKGTDEYKIYIKKLSEQKLGEKNPMFGIKQSDKQKESIKRAYLEGRIIVPKGGSRKGIKNKNPRSDIKEYRLVSPTNEEYIVHGRENLQKFCSVNKIQYHILLKNFNVRLGENEVGLTSTAKNTIGWIIFKLENNNDIIRESEKPLLSKFENKDIISRPYRETKFEFINPSGQIFLIKGWSNFNIFIKENKLSQRIIKKAINQGKINESQIGNKRSLNNINWEVRKYEK